MAYGDQQQHSREAFEHLGVSVTALKTENFSFLRCRLLIFLYFRKKAKPSFLYGCTNLMRVSQGLVNQGRDFTLLSGANQTCPRESSELGLQGLQVLVVRFVNLCFVQWGLLGPLKQVLIHVPVIAAKNRAEGHILEVKGVHQSNSIGAD